ncbi:MAG TPA: hypothetical protein VNH11_16740 [Pirellulales bacterium]|nr:hypothetical protein [Pirellulales bacterium]
MMRASWLRARQWHCFFGAVVVLSLACAAAPPACAAAPPFDVNVLDKEFSNAARDNPKLRGAWIDVEYEPNADEALPGKFTVRRVLDTDRAASQRVEIDRLVHAWLSGANYELKPRADRLYPFSRLLADLEVAIETDATLSGCQISGGYYAADPNEPGALNLVLRGRMAREDQDVAIEGLCGRLMRRDPAWVKPGAGKRGEAAEVPLAITPKTTELTVVGPSEANGRWFYAAGLRHFWKLDYARAAHAFHQATLESPRKLQYHYWWIVSDLAQGKGQLARRRMDMVVRRFRDEDFDHQSPEYRLVVRSLERVQGPLRTALQRLETQALFGNSQLGANY